MEGGTELSNLVVGQEIVELVGNVSGEDPTTGDELWQYTLKLANGTMVDLLPDDVREIAEAPPTASTPRLQVIDGKGSLVGERVVSVISRPIDTSVQSEGGAGAGLRQVGLLLSSRRIALNVYLCGGGNLLHLESVEGVRRHFSEDWYDRWTGEPVDLDLGDGSAYN